jgi:hypothetical protein
MCMSAVISGKLASAQTNMGKGDIVPDYKKLERVVRQTSSTVEGRMESHLIRGKQETEATAAAQCEIEEIQSDVKRSSHLPNNLCGAPTESNTKTKTCLHRSKTSAEIDEVALETVLTSASCRSRSSMSQPPAEMSLSLGAGQLDADVDADAALCVSVNDDEKKRKPVASMTLKNLLPMQDVITDTQKQVFSGKQPRLIRFFPSNNQSKTVTSPIMATDERLKSMTSSTEETFCASTVSDGNMTSADKRSLAPLTAAGSRQDSNSEQSRRDEDKSRVPGVSDFPGVRCRPSRIPRPVRRRMETMSRSRESSAERKRKSDAVVDVGMSNYLRHVTVGNDGSAMNSATKTADITPVSGESQDGSKSVVSVSATVSTTIRGSKFHDLLEYRRFARRSMEARWKALWRRARVMRWRRPRGDWRWQTEAEYGNMAEDEQQMTAYEKLDGPSTNSTGTLKQSPSELFSTTLDAERVAPKSDCAAPDHPPKEAQSTSHSSNATAAEVAVDPGIVAEAMKRIASSDAGARSKKSDCQLRRANNRCATTETGSINRTGVVSFSQIFASDVEGATNNSAITFDESTAAAEKLFPASNAGLSTSNNRTDVSDLQAEGKIGSHIGLIEDKKRNIERLLPKDSTDYVSKRTASSPAVVDQHLAHRTTSDDDVEYDRRWSTGNVQQQQQQQQQFIADNSMMRSNDDKRPERNLSQVDSKTEEVSHNQIETSVGEQCFWQSDDQLCTVINRTKHVVGLTRMSVETTRQDVTEQRRSEQVRLFKNRHKLGNGVGGMAVKPRNSIRVVTTCVRSRNRRSYTRLKYGRKRKSAEQSERCRLKVNFSDECHHCGQPRAEAANHDVIHHSSYGIEDAFYLKMGIISFLSNMRCCDGMRSRYVIRSCCSVAESSCKSATAVTAPVAATDDFSSVSAAQTASTKMLDMSQRLPCSPRACVETPVSQSCASSGNCFRCDDDKDRDRIRSHHVGASVTQVVTRNRRSPTSSVSDRCSRTVDGGTEWTRHMKSRFVHFNSAAGVLSEERLNRSCEQIATCEDVVAGITNNVSHDEQQCKCGMFSDRDSCNKIFLTDSPRFTCGQFNRSSAIDCLKNNSWSLSKEDAETPGGEHVETSKQLQSVVVGHCRFAGRRSSKIQQKLHYYPDIGTSVSGQRRPNELVSELGCAVGCLPMPGSEKATDIRRHLGASRRLLTDGIMSLTGSAAVVSDRS